MCWGFLNNLRYHLLPALEKLSVQRIGFQPRVYRRTATLMEII